MLGLEGSMVRALPAEVKRLLVFTAEEASGFDDRASVGLGSSASADASSSVWAFRFSAHSMHTKRLSDVNR
jgi:hypothetical protein